MKLNIKLTSGLKFSTEFTGETVLECKQHLTDEHSCAAPTLQRLVYKGRILDDAKKLKEDYEIAEGATLFLVAMKETTAPATAKSGSTTAVANSVATATTPDMSHLIQQMTQMQTQSSPLASFPSSSRRTPPAATPTDPLSSDPMMQSLLNDVNPDFLAQMMQSQMENNPALQRLMAENPMVREALSDPAALRQMMQSMNNPELRAQQQRHHDLALANIENMPGGFNMLRNLYETVQVPMEEAASSSTASATASSSSRSGRNSNGANSTTNSTSDATAGATNQAMPNPWGSPRTTSTNRNNAMMMMDNPFSARRGDSLFSTGAAGGNPFAMGTAGNPLTPAMGAGGFDQPQPSREQQEAAIAMLETNPALQQMLSASIRQNPAMMRQLLQNANPAVAQFMNGMSDEQLSSLLEMATNPAAMRGIMRMQEQMQNNGPNNGTVMPNPMDMLALMSGAGATPFGGANPFVMGTPFPGVAGANAPNPWANSSSSSSSLLPAAAVLPPPPAVRYARQLEQMRSMGFDDEAAALSALERAHGNLNRAVDLLLDGSTSSTGGENATADS